MSKKSNIKLGIALVVGSTIVASGSGIAQNKGKKKIKNKAKLKKELVEIETIDIDPEIFPNAMCYIPALPENVSFTCPQCGKETWNRYWDLNDVGTIENIVERIKGNGYDVLVSLSEFCEHCSNQKIEMPSIIFKIRFSDEKDYHVVKSNILNEYMSLQEFLDKKENPYFRLNDNMEILKKMTGLKEDNIIEMWQNKAINEEE